MRNSGQISTKDRVKQRYEWTDTQFLRFFRGSKPIFNHMLKFRWDVGIHSIEKILKLFSRVDVGNVCKYLHLFFKFVLQESVMDADDSLDIYATNHILHEVFRVEPGFDEVNAADEPLLTRFAFLQPDVASGFEFGEQFSDGNLINFSKFFVD
jgi:tRNA(Ile)-lysidine synthase TilS/MesJ